MIRFEDRKDAGRRLGEVLAPMYQSANPLILGIPKGGVEVALQIARRLEATLSIVLVRKLPMPGNPEAGFGAIAEDGTLHTFAPALTALLPDTVHRTIEQQKREIARQAAVFRHGEPLPPLHGRTVILVDDGIAMGSTIRAAIALCRKQRAGRVVVAAPVADPGVAGELADEADDVVVLDRPSWFRAVAESYRHWYDVSDEEVVDLLEESRQTAPPG
jgi:putative phosphoribosyl transferase